MEPGAFHVRVRHDTGARLGTQQAQTPDRHATRDLRSGRADTGGRRPGGRERLRLRDGVRQRRRPLGSSGVAATVDLPGPDRTAHGRSGAEPGRRSTPNSPTSTSRSPPPTAVSRTPPAPRTTAPSTRARSSTRCGRSARRRSSASPPPSTRSRTAPRAWTHPGRVQPAPHRDRVGGRGRAAARTRRSRGRSEGAGAGARRQGRRAAR